MIFNKFAISTFSAIHFDFFCMETIQSESCYLEGMVNEVDEGLDEAGKRIKNLRQILDNWDRKPGHPTDLRGAKNSVYLG